MHSEAEQEPPRNKDERCSIIFCHSKDFDLDGFWCMVEALKTDDYVMDLLAMDELDVNRPHAAHVIPTPGQRSWCNEQNFGSPG